MLEGLLEALKGRDEVVTPLTILKEHSELMFLDKQLCTLAEEAAKLRKELEDDRLVKHKEIWDKIHDYLDTAGIEANRDVNLRIKDGVLYKTEEK